MNLAGSIKSKMRIAPLLPPGPEETLTIVSLARSPPCAPLLSPSARVRELQRYSMPSSLTNSRPILRQYVKGGAPGYPGDLARTLGRRFVGELAEAKPQKGDDRSLFGTHALDLWSQIELGLLGQSGEQGSVKVAFENLRMDVASATDRRCVAKMLCHPLDGTNDRAFAHGIAVDMLELAQRKRCQVRTCPGPEILGSNLLASNLVQIGIDLGRRDGMAHAGIVEILEQLISRKVAARFNNARKPRIIDIPVVQSTTFTAKTQVYVATLNLRMPVAQGRQAKLSLFLAYWLLPMRNNVNSKRRTIAASTRSHGRP